MASSVSSERAFSQGGITISKYRSRLKGDIVEALQCVKCIIRQELIYREPGPSSSLETELSDDDDDDDDLLEGEEDKGDDDGLWDALIDDEDDTLAMGGDDDDDFDVDMNGFESVEE